ncbi:hypothetical protein AYO21_10594 [Fonsecaea monophora]|uniref:Enoyl reductase (ER) domain-containing protein n=1 Tax=Fonsecaea monophora TaxID=254056 RepID=A0A177EU97_9EURO|nr:hypothetical protein AYO21_10594 [Fonsecaea monophora]KAH0829687.1 Alcohol dehydrogenase 2 [Fonsecaea pedrosoi]OAG35196.1 hypothetical protein AYO21_10594 [Fonsecaea monophora]
MADMTIPKRHKAAVYSQPGTTAIEIVEVDTPEPEEGEVLIRLSHSGVCHSDYSFIMNAWEHMPESTPRGQVGGHEGVGTVVKVGRGVKARKVGDRVGVKWITSTCLTCDMCLVGDEGRCPFKKVSGYRNPGTFQQYVCSDAAYVTPIPDGLDSALAAPLLCGGVTVYNALLKGNLKPGDWVALSGAGGGLGHLAIQYAKSMGFQVIGIDHGSKKEFCLGIGANVFLDFTQYNDAQLFEEVKRVTNGGCHAVLVLNGSTKSYDQGLDMLRYGGTLVCVGVPEKAMPLQRAQPHFLITNQLSIRGTVVGNRRDAVECMKPAARGEVKTKISIEPLSKLSQVFDDMGSGRLQGRAVIDVWKL